MSFAGDALADHAGFHPVHCAAEHDEPGALLALQSLGASLEAADEDGRTPAHLAALSGRRDVLKLLQEANCNLEPPPRTEGPRPTMQP